MEILRSKTPGTIVTFYSYKGGTGRSLALANVAWILASCGRRVAVVDWDLEAPGLHRYFQPFMVDGDLTDTNGLIDYFWDTIRKIMTLENSSDKSMEELTDLLNYTVNLEWDFKNEGTIDFIPAGRQGANYPQRVNSFDWDNFYERLGGGHIIQEIRNRLCETYDIVLIDSRIQHSIKSISRATITSLNALMVNLLVVVLSPVYGLISRIWNLQTIYFSTAVFLFFFSLWIFINRAEYKKLKY